MTTTKRNPVTLHARHEHGGYTVQVHPPGEGSKTLYTVSYGGSRGDVVYNSGRKLVRALYNAGELGPGTRDPGMSVDRYFRIGKHKPSNPFTTLDIFDGSLSKDLTPGRGPLIRVGRTRTRKPRRSMSFGLRAHPLVDGVNGKRGKPLESASWATQLGIDLENRSHEVRKLLFAGFGRLIAAKGYDPEDVYQEVLRGILARNYGTCPWDASKSTFGHYVHMICGCVLKNYHRKQSRRAEFEQIGMYGLDGDGEYSVVDAAETSTTYSVTHAVSSVPEDKVGMEMAVGSLSEYLMATGRPEASLAVRVLPYVGEGYSRGEIAQKMSLEPTKIGKAMSLIRKTAKIWQADQVL